MVNSLPFQAVIVIAAACSVIAIIGTVGALSLQPIAHEKASAPLVQPVSNPALEPIPVSVKGVECKEKYKGWVVRLRVLGDDSKTRVVCVSSNFQASNDSLVRTASWPSVSDNSAPVEPDDNVEPATTSANCVKPVSQGGLGGRLVIMHDSGEPASSREYECSISDGNDTDVLYDAPPTDTPVQPSKLTVDECQRANGNVVKATDVSSVRHDQVTQLPQRCAGTGMVFNPWIKG